MLWVYNKNRILKNIHIIQKKIGKNKIKKKEKWNKSRGGGQKTYHKIIHLNPDI